MIENYALVNRLTHLVERIIYWDGVSELYINDYPGQLIGRYELIRCVDQAVGTWAWDETAKIWFMNYTIGDVPPVGFEWDNTRFTNPHPKPDFTPANSDTAGTVPF